MLLVLRVLVVVAIAGGAMSPLVAGETIRSDDVAAQAAVDTSANECQLTPDDSVYGMAESPDQLPYWGYCYDDCSRCSSRADCGGFPCTEIKLCFADSAPEVETDRR